MTQNLIPIGNSTGIIIPQDVLIDSGLKRGDSVSIEKKGKGIFLVPQKNQKKNAQVDAKFMKLVEEFMDEHDDVLRELAGR